jgi:hypothetical protein
VEDALDDGEHACSERDVSHGPVAGTGTCAAAGVTSRVITATGWWQCGQSEVGGAALVTAFIPGTSLVTAFAAAAPA